MTNRRGGRRRRTIVRSVNIVWTDRALHDLGEIDEYISRDNPNASRRWINKLIAAATQAAIAPLAGRVVPEKNRQDIREVFVRTYRIAYRVREERIDILTVFEGHHEFPKEVSSENE
jgi:toxin ParE1/3/4